MLNLEIWKLGLLLAAGLLAGFINSVAGSGSLLTLPALLFLGLPADIANGTNRIGIASQGIAAVLGYRKGGVTIIPKTLYLLIPCVLGAFLGSTIAIQLSTAVIRIAITVILLSMIGVMFLNPRRWEREEGDYSQIHRRPLVWSILFIIGAYAGFIQVGTGFLLLFALVLVGEMDLLNGNVLKNIAQLVLQLSALPVYLHGGKINWTAGLTLAMGMSLGAWFGSRMAAKRGVKFLRAVIITAVVLFSSRQILEWVGILR